MKLFDKEVAEIRVIVVVTSLSMAVVLAWVLVANSNKFRDRGDGPCGHLDCKQYERRRFN